MEPSSPVPSQFCARCMALTSDDFVGDTQTFWGIGPIFYGSSDPCSTCHSVVQRLCLCFMWIPVWPGNAYRVIYIDSGVFSSSYYSRRVLNAAPPLISRGVALVLIGVLALVIGIGQRLTYAQGYPNPDLPRVSTIFLVIGAVLLIAGLITGAVGVKRRL